MLLSPRVGVAAPWAQRAEKGERVCVVVGLHTRCVRCRGITLGVLSKHEGESVLEVMIPCGGNPEVKLQRCPNIVVAQKRGARSEWSLWKSGRKCAWVPTNEMVRCWLGSGVRGPSPLGLGTQKGAS